MKRRLLLAAACAAALPVAGRQLEIPLAASLADELAAALRVRRPLVVMVSLDGCAYCKVVREQHLLPLRGNDSQPMVQVDMRSQKPVIDLGGQRRTHDELVRAWGVDAAPTVLFLGPGGREIAQRLRGASIPDFYGAYLEERIATARRALDR